MIATGRQAPNRPGSSGRALWRRASAVQARVPVMQLLLAVAVFEYGSATLPGLSSWASIKTILVLASLVGLASVGQTLLILMGGFDLSVAGFMLAGALVVTVLTGKYHIPFGVGLAGAVVAAGLLGAVAGRVCHRYRIQPLIVTLAMGSIAVGLVQVQTAGGAEGFAPQWLTTLTSSATHTFGIDVPPLVVMWLIVAVALILFLHRTVIGRRLLATGSNPRAADYALIRTRRIWTLAFAFSAVTSVLVGILVAGFAGSVDGQVTDPYLFQSVVVVIVGGTVFGGPGDYLRTVAGTLFLTVLGTVLIGHGASEPDQQILYGVMILGTVAVYGRGRRLTDRI